MNLIFEDETILKNLIGEKLKVKDCDGNSLTLTMIDITSFTTYITNNKIIKATFVDFPNSIKTTQGRKKLFEMINNKNKTFTSSSLLKLNDVIAFYIIFQYYPNFDLSSEGFLNLDIDFSYKFKSFKEMLQSETAVKYYIDFLKLIMKQKPDLIDELKFSIRQWFFGGLLLGREATNQDYSQFDLDYEEFKKSLLESIKTTDIEME